MYLVTQQCMYDIDHNMIHTTWYIQLVGQVDIANNIIAKLLSVSFSFSK